jgi:DNA-binding NtrC family response regulator
MERILLVGGDPLEARALASSLSDEYSVLHCPEPGGAPEAARRCSPAAVILCLPPSCGEREELVRRTLAKSSGAPLVVVSSEADPEAVVGCLRSGASDFLPRPCDPDRLRRCLASALAGRRSCPEGDALFVGTSAGIKAAEEKLRLFARSAYPVLVLGESGTGKELAARALWDFSPRRGGPFVARNCAAIPEILAESELFGTERGAFTDAVSRPGAFELARGGLLFLDEIGEAGAAVQAKLLRVLETREFWRLGARRSAAADFRFVSATSRDLERAVGEGRFRSDLLYRIETLIVEMPPLRERREDIALLAAHFALEGSEGRACFQSEAIEKLSGYAWPGNVRQLRNIVQRALVLSGGADEISAEHVELR